MKYFANVHRPNACELPFCTCDLIDVHTITGWTPEHVMTLVRRHLRALENAGFPLPPLVVVTHPAEVRQWW